MTDNNTNDGTRIAEETVVIGLPRVLNAIDLYDTTEAVGESLEANIGGISLISLARQFHDPSEYHPDGVYELARIKPGNKKPEFSNRTYNAEFLDGSNRVVPFSISNLGGILTADNLEGLPLFLLKENPGRVVKAKVDGEFSVPRRKVLESQRGKVVIANNYSDQVYPGKYRPGIVEAVGKSVYHLRVMGEDGALHIQTYDIGDLESIMVLERNASIDVRADTRVKYLAMNPHPEKPRSPLPYAVL